MTNKVLYGQKKRDNVARILYDIWDHEDGPETEKRLIVLPDYIHDQYHDGTCLCVFCFAYLYDMTKTTT